MLTPHARTTRLATLERQLTRYVAGWRGMAPPSSPRAARFRTTQRRGVLTRRVRAYRALRTTGRERFYDVALTDEEARLIEALVTSTKLQQGRLLRQLRHAMAQP
jgi:hypothetical protein